VLKKLERAELSVCDNAASFLQSRFWGGFKARFGWEALAFLTEWESGARPLLLLRRRLAPGFSLAYVPWGPELPPGFPAEGRWAGLRELALHLREQLPRDTVFIRFDPPWWYSEVPGVSPPPPFVRSGADIQPPDTVLVDLKQPMESVVERMKPKWRYNARLSVKKGVTVNRAGPDETGVFYDLLKETARRDGIAIHGQEYYRTLIENDWYGGETPDLRLYLARHEGDVLAGIVTLFWRQEAVYLYGASSDIKRNLMAPYALQLKAMEDAKASGCTEYDLFGIPPGENPLHPMAGLYRFKTGFGGRIIHRPGSWDYPCRPLVYRLFRGAEALRRNLRTMKKRFLRGNKLRLF
jgi:lipid II:glycine glycyltransferase (peptidoglycan interpeptide bridge formation enzyme)